MKISIVIPAYNEEKTIGRVVADLGEAGYKNIIVVNDGSSDNTAKLADQAGAKVVRHIINRGYGAATVTGLQAALKNGADMIVTFDADGQHRAADVAKALAPIIGGWAEVVTGSRFLQDTARPNSVRAYLNIPFKRGQLVPLKRRFFNLAGRILTFLLFGIRVSDSQTGFRAISALALDKMDLKGSGMEFSSEFFKEIKRLSLRWVEVPIKVEYTEYSLSKGQRGFRQAFHTAGKLFFRKLND